MKRLVGVLWVSLMAGCAISTTQDYDTSFDFSRLRSYVWQPPTQRGAESNTLVDERIRRAVDGELAKKKYQKATDAGPSDFAVTYHYAIDNYTDYHGGSRVGIGVGRGSYGGGYGSVGVGIPIGGADRTYQQDTLTIDVVDPKTGKLLWRGVARQDYDARSNPQELTERFNMTVEAILGKFPPK